MSISRMSAGTGYEYLMRSVAAGDGGRDLSSALTRYYTESGNPPGFWVGTGLTGLDNGHGLEAGSVVSEMQMFRLFGMGYDPVSGAELGSRPYRFDPTTGRGSVAGFDLTFSVPKSVSVWWALSDPQARNEILLAHEAAIASTVQLIEAEVAATRVGTNGVAQVDVRGVIGAAFHHWDSRAGDPHLHTHVVVANRVQTADGKWRTLDSRALYKSVVAMSETYHGLLADELTRRLGVAWDARARTHSAVPAWEVTGVSNDLIELFSRRSQAIRASKDDLVETFRAEHGREPTAVEVLRLRQQATLTTRPEKHLHSLADRTKNWRERAAEIVGPDIASWAPGVAQTPATVTPKGIATEPELTADSLRLVAASVRETVETKRSTWGRWNLFAEASRQLMSHRFDTPAERLAATEHVVAVVIGESVQLDPPTLTTTPPALQRPDGTSSFTHRHSQTYTSRALLEAEARLLSAGRDRTAPRINPDLARRVCTTNDVATEHPLDTEQLDAIAAIASSGRTLDVLIGPAGSGKTLTLARLRAAWETLHGEGSVIGLAPSAAAAAVLADSLRIATENTAKWLTEAALEPERLTDIQRGRAIINRAEPHRIARLRPVYDRLRTQIDRVEKWRFHPGQLVILDEASLAGTIALDQIVSQAQAVGAKVLLVGDPAQLGAIDAGGAFRLLADDQDNPPELGTVRRFTTAWEGPASRQLRTGTTAALDHYLAHERIQIGTDDSMADAAYEAWAADEASGLKSLLIAADHATVTALNQRARADRVTSNQVNAAGTTLADGSTAGVGDRVVTRRNDRHLTTGRSFVKNGDPWTVTAHHHDGSLTVQRPTGGPVITLPADYVAEHVELGYATTAYRTQGSTVDTAHVLINPDTTNRETFYVAMTRGRTSNTAYISPPATSDCDGPQNPEQSGREILEKILATTANDISAHQTMRAVQDQAMSLPQLIAEYDTIAATARQAEWNQLLTTAGATPDQIHQIQSSVSFSALTTVLHDVDTTGLDIHATIRTTLTAPDIAQVRDLAAVLRWRLERLPGQADLPRRAQRIVGLLPRIHSTDTDTEQALRKRHYLITHRAQTAVDTALAAGEPWIKKLGEPPTNPLQRATWTEHARTLAAYRDLYPVGTDVRPTAEHFEAMQRATAALTGQPISPSRSLISEPHHIEPPSHTLGF